MVHHQRVRLANRLPLVAPRRVAGLTSTTVCLDCPDVSHSAAVGADQRPRARAMFRRSAARCDVGSRRLAPKRADPATIGGAINLQIDIRRSPSALLWHFGLNAFQWHLAQVKPRRCTDTERRPKLNSLRACTKAFAFLRLPQTCLLSMCGVDFLQDSCITGPGTDFFVET
ncbi:unnamed protein product [Symbiodinium sp. CCMP2592]|nr:unnamed protein product [Symbiodinium sp. CCMP2592]